MIKNIFRKLFASRRLKKSIITSQIHRYKKYAIGEYTYGTPDILFDDGRSNLIIGKYCSIADGVSIMLGGNHRVDWVTTFPLGSFFSDIVSTEGHPSSKGDVIIGNDVWIGQNSFILSGVKIGNGAVIGACSVVTKDVPDYGIVAGNPAKLVKMRFSKSEINKLLEIEWWNWPIEKVIRAWPEMKSGDLNRFFDMFIGKG